MVHRSEKGKALAAAERPISATVITAPIQGPPGWRKFPTWSQISSKDRMIQPAAQKMMANRAALSDHIISIEASHAPMLRTPRSWRSLLSKRLITPP
jgi:hypothetical protein